MIATLFRNRAAQHRLAAAALAGVVAARQALPAANAAPPAALIAIDDLVKEYATGAGPVRVLHDVSLRVQPGEFVAVVGASGSGKSTLINMITGIDRPTSGDVQVAGQRLNDLDENGMARWRGRNVGVIFQFFQLLPALTILENVVLPMDFCNTWPAHERTARAMHLLDQVEMADQAHKLPGAVSGGQKQRAAIARALANDPPLLVGDEPTGNLDSRTADRIFGLFGDLAARAATVEQLTESRERNRLAREMHDTLAHSLTGLSVQLQALGRLMASDPDAAQAQLKAAQATVRDGIGEARRSIQALRATPLADLGLSEALRQLCRSYAERLAIAFDCHIDDVGALDPATEQAIYRTAEAALANVEQHAGAAQVSVRLEQEDGALTLRVRDDGVGFDAEAVASDRYGLAGMRERAVGIGATLDVRSGLGLGTEIAFTTRGNSVWQLL